MDFLILKLFQFSFSAFSVLLVLRANARQRTKENDLTIVDLAAKQRFLPTKLVKVRRVSDVIRSNSNHSSNTRKDKNI